MVSFVVCFFFHSITEFQCQSYFHQLIESMRKICVKKWNWKFRFAMRKKRPPSLCVCEKRHGLIIIELVSSKYVFARRIKVTGWSACVIQLDQYSIRWKMSGKQTHIKCETLSAINMFYGIRIRLQWTWKCIFFKARGGIFQVFYTFICDCVRRVSQEQRAVMWKTIFNMNFM